MEPNLSNTVPQDTVITEWHMTSLSFHSFSLKRKVCQLPFIIFALLFMTLLVSLSTSAQNFGTGHNRSTDGCKVGYLFILSIFSVKKKV